MQWSGEKSLAPAGYQTPAVQHDAITIELRDIIITTKRICSRIRGRHRKRKGRNRILRKDNTRRK
jgi:hypothetical protein